LYGDLKQVSFESEINEKRHKSSQDEYYGTTLNEDIDPALA